MSLPCPHTLSDHRVQQVVVGTEDDGRALHQFTGGEVRARAETSTQRDQVLHVPGLLQSVDPQTVVVPHPLDAVVEATGPALFIKHHSINMSATIKLLVNQLID